MINANQNTSMLKEIPTSGTSLLPQWGLIFVEGSEAAAFLQNQLTNSVLGLRRTFSPEVAELNANARLVGYCSPKGRLLASAWLSLAPTNDTADDRFALFISKDIAASTAKRLAMHVLRSKVKVLDVSNEWMISGYISSSPTDETPNDLLQDGQIGIALPSVLQESKNFRRILIAQEGSSSLVVDDDVIRTAWNDLEVLSGIPRIVQATQEQFVPQMINFESVAGVDFKKGCYPGQEIVARSQYRGSIKRRLCLAHTTVDSFDSGLIPPGTEIFHSDDLGQPAGMVVLSAPSSFVAKRIDLQVECKLEAMENGEIRLGSAQGPVLKLDSLPYPLIEI
jgi:folate-binding protein YgfZ